MGDDMGSGSVTGCCLWSLGWDALHLLCENQNKRNPNRCHHPLITRSLLMIQFVILHISRLLAIKMYNLFVTCFHEFWTTIFFVKTCHKQVSKAGQSVFYCMLTFDCIQRFTNFKACFRTIHLRRQYFLGEKRSEIGQICQQIVV